eukprot:scaffold100591_cov20-Tisochrysis_lutea.AAC.2
MVHPAPFLKKGKGDVCVEKEKGRICSTVDRIKLRSPYSVLWATHLLCASWNIGCEDDEKMARDLHRAHVVLLNT